MSLSATVEIDAPFYDMDMLRIAWHGHYFKYFERARCALLDRIDFNYTQMEASGYLWPIVDCRVKFIRPVRFGQRIAVTARLTEYENRLKLNYRIHDSASGEKLSTAWTVQVAVHQASGELCFVSPDILLEKVRCALA